MNLKKWIITSGLMWGGIGLYLMIKGLKWIGLALMLPVTPTLLGWLSRLAFSTHSQAAHQGGLLLILISLFIGFLKARLVLSRTVDRVVSRFKTLSSPIQLAQAYDRKYYILLSCMMGLGILFRFLPIPYDIRGAVDVAIGSALLNGGMIYFRELFKLPKKAT